MTLALALEANSKAVKLMQKNRYSEAIRSFGHFLRDFMVFSENENHWRFVEQSRNEMQCNSLFIMYAVKLPEVEPSLNSEFPPSCGSFEVFNKAFVVLNTEIQQSNAVANGETYLYRAVALYNLGLALHRQGIQDCSSSHLKRSLQVYEVAMINFLHYEDEQVQLANIGNIEHPLLKLAIINNVSHLHLTFSNQCQVQLWELLLEDCLHRFPPPLDELAEEISLLHADDYSFFSLSLLCCSCSQHVTMCASAA